MTTLSQLGIWILGMIFYGLSCLCSYLYGDLNHEYSSWAEKKRKKYRIGIILFFAIGTILIIFSFR